MLAFLKNETNQNSGLTLRADRLVRSRLLQERPRRVGDEITGNQAAQHQQRRQAGEFEESGFRIPFDQPAQQSSQASHARPL
jgi:hypothetical protein